MAALGLASEVNSVESYIAISLPADSEEWTRYYVDANRLYLTFICQKLQTQTLSL